GAGRVILVVGTQKIVPELEEGLLRISEYASRLEDARAQAAYGVRSAVNKLLIINRELTPARLTVVLVDEVLGFYCPGQRHTRLHQPWQSLNRGLATASPESA